MKQGLVLLKVAGMLLALVILYVASFGPASGYVAFHGTMRNWDAYNRFYGPLHAVIDRSPALARPLLRYKYQWAPLPKGGGESTEWLYSL